MPRKLGNQRDKPLEYNYLKIFPPKMLISEFHNSLHVLYLYIMLNLKKWNKKESEKEKNRKHS
ncbi:MAG TPA: hypothetical protein DCY97_02740 [Marinilabiliales bacterium]|nr:hypothetical protein [Marinilabiliales bacterium]